MNKKERSIYNKKYNLLNKDRKDYLNRKYHQEHKNEINERHKNWYRNNKDKRKEYVKNNPEVNLKALRKRLEKLGKIFNMTSIEYQYALISWANSIKKLDNNMCKNCDSKENLNAHHIKPKKDFPELSLDLNNGITLCEKCHSEIHGFEIY
ncbi:HNH endonuclease [Nitrosopumilus sp.]|uniref:HNH endonuclease n=1 Tax=Nitrosopumilus sp. TaxID=2024843 RepID=UPI003D0E9AF6